jgi:hypothetical protein
LILINGLLIFVVGLVVKRQIHNGSHITNRTQSLFYLPSGPTRTQTVLWRKSWFTKREQSEPYLLPMAGSVPTLKVIMIKRLLRDDTSKGRTGTKTHTSMCDIWNTLKDPGEC